MARTTLSPAVLARRSVAALVLLLVALGCGTTTERGVTRTVGTPSTTTTPAPSPTTTPTEGPGELGSVTAPLRLAPPDGGSFVVHGRFPLTPSPCLDPDPTTLAGRFPGTLRIDRADDGSLSLSVILPFERYLEGIAEVPPSWPEAAL